VRKTKYLFRFLSTKLPIDWKWYVRTELEDIYASKNAEGLKILDLGAGPAKYWLQSPLREFLIETGSRLTLLDAAPEFSETLSEHGNAITRVQGIVPESLLSYEEDSFDLVIAIDLIEHLSKSQGYLMLYEIDRIGKFGQIIMTPNGFTWQPPSLNNPYNAHISGWTPKELRKIGFKSSRGQIGSFLNFGPYGLPKTNSKKWYMLEILALDSIISFVFPRISSSFISIKRKKNPRIYTHV
jgi:hypothetical protein